MASTSPYQNNDYQAASAFRPYQLPVNDIFKAISAQDEFWEAGARRVKSLYNNALDLQLSLEPNKQIRDQYIQEAEKQLTKLSTMNLSDPTVQKQGFALFKPLFDDKGIMSDDQATRHIQKVNNEALMYRTKDNGKEYSSTNHQYALTGAKEFKNAQDRMAGVAYLNQAKEYEPFYDPSSELSTILKNCKPSQATMDTTQGFYIREYSDQSLTSAKINTCMDAGLSDRARRQLQINGAVTYQGKPEALRDNYIPYLQGTRSQLGEQKAAIEGVLTNKDNLKNLSKEELSKLGISNIAQITPEFIKSLEEKKMGLDDRISNLSSSISQLQMGNFQSITGENYENVASAVFSRDYIHNVGEGFSYDFTKNTVKADPIQMMFYQQKQINDRQNDDHMFEREMQTKKFTFELQKALLDRKNTGMTSLRGLFNDAASVDEYRVDNATNSPFATIDKNDSYEQVTTRRQGVADKRAIENSKIDADLKNFYGMPREYKQGSPEWKQWYDNFSLTSKNDPEKQRILGDYETKIDRLNLLEDFYRGTQESVDKALAPKSAEVENKITNINPVVIRDGGQQIVFSPRTVYNVLQGKSAPGYTVVDKELYDVNGLAIPHKEVLFNGKPYQELRSLANTIQDRTKEGVEDLKKKRNELMANETVIQNQGYLIPQLNTMDPKSPSFRMKIAQDLAVDAKHVNIGQIDANGRVIVTLEDPKKSETNYDHAGALQRLINYGAGNNQVIDATGNPDPNGHSVVLTGINELDIVDENNISHLMESTIRNKERLTTVSQSQSTGYMRAANGHQYRMAVSGGGGSYTYRILDQNKPNSPLLSFQDRDVALQSFEKLLQTKTK